MSDTIITVEKLGKRYSLRHQRTEPYTALRDVLTDKARSLFRRRAANGHLDPTKEDFWALRDVSFEVKRGEVLGIIGRNGAGKSTLLKILSRITEPTTGTVRLKGRVASLLEVGTGFHPELTGRENIFLNGAILGMSRVEIKAKFDEIVAFAEVERFLDTPVKRYSSGMYVRLAFAVAAHLEPEILIIDEVLAVGDAEFQTKCLGKMKNVSSHGRTVLFVSHHLPSVEALCSRALLLAAGRIAHTGPAAQITAKYLQSAALGQTLEAHAGVIKQVTIMAADGGSSSSLRVGEAATIRVDLDLGDRTLSTPEVGIGFDASPGHRIFTIGSYFSSQKLSPLRGKTSVFCTIPSVPLVPGSYSLKVALSSGLHEPIDAIETGASIDVLESDFFGNGRLPNSQQGLIVVRSDWRVGESEVQT